MPSERRPRINAFVGYFLPGTRAGGPPRSVANLVEGLGSSFDVRIYTRNHDFGLSAPFDLEPFEWLPTPGGRVMYLAPGPRALVALARAAIDAEADVIYLNSVFARAYSMWPLLTRLIAGRRMESVVLAPRGELARVALANKPGRKRLYLGLLRATGAHRRILWAASSDHELRDIQAALGPGVRVALSPPVPTRSSLREPLVTGRKDPGELRALFVGRVLPHKGLHIALELLRTARGRVHLDVAGPIEDARYWAECEASISTLPANATVTYRGVLARAELEQAFARAHLFVLPTRSENFGHAIAEALAAGLPVLIGDGTPWRDLREEGAGWALSLDDREGFLAAVHEMIAMNHDAHLRQRDAVLRYVRRVTVDSPLIELNAEVFRLATPPTP